MTEEEKMKAMRLARAIASDISLYNEQKIIKGLEQDNLFDVLKDEIEEGRELYKSRVSSEIFTKTNFFDRAIIDIVMRPKGHVKSKHLVSGPKAVSAEGARGERLDRWLTTRLPGLSRARIQALIEEGRVQVGGRPATRRAAPEGRRGDHRRGARARAVAAVARGDRRCRCVFQDAGLLVLDKAAGLVVHPGAGHRTGTLVNALLHHVKDLGGIGGELRPGIVHRLDKDTSGLLVVAKNEPALEALQRPSRRREVDKRYLALVWGQPPDAGDVRHAARPRTRGAACASPRE